MMPYGDADLVNIGSNNGFLPDGTKPQPKPILTYYRMFCDIHLRAMSHKVLINLTGNMYDE